jgi:hypothetical protein
MDLHRFPSVAERVECAYAPPARTIRSLSLRLDALRRFGQGGADRQDLQLLDPALGEVCRDDVAGAATHERPPHGRARRNGPSAGGTTWRRRRPTWRAAGSKRR